MANEILDRVTTEEERRHEERISENYKKLLDLASPVKEREKKAEVINSASVETPEKPSPVLVSVDPSQNTVRRISTFVVPPAPAPTKKVLFEDVKYTKGSYTSAPKAAYAPVADPVYAPAAPEVQAPEVQAPVAETASPVLTEEDVTPTARTMNYRTEQTASEQRVGFWAALSTNTKLLLAAVVTAIVVALMIVCINTAVLNNLEAENQEKQAELRRLSQISEELEGRIDDATSTENINEWALEHGMTRG